jgi:hypothetical protein
MVEQPLAPLPDPPRPLRMVCRAPGHAFLQLGSLLGCRLGDDSCSYPFSSMVLLR